jgi:hypothetical protein
VRTLVGIEFEIVVVGVPLMLFARCSLLRRIPLDHTIACRWPQDAVQAPFLYEAKLVVILDRELTAKCPVVHIVLDAFLRASLSLLSRTTRRHFGLCVL